MEVDQNTIRTEDEGQLEELSDLGLALAPGRGAAHVERPVQGTRLVHAGAEEESRGMLERVAGLKDPYAQALLDLPDREDRVDRARGGPTGWQVAQDRHRRGLDRPLCVVPDVARITSVSVLHERGKVRQGRTAYPAARMILNS